MSLDTLANVKTALGITTSSDDTLLSQLQEAAESWITDYCGRVFTGGTFIEHFPGGRRLLLLRNFPVASVTSVEVDSARQFGPSTIREPSTYVLHGERGVLEAIDGAFLPPSASRGSTDAYPGAVQVTYTTSSNQVPAAIIRAYAELIGHWYRQVKTHVLLGQTDQLSQFQNDILTQFPRGLSEGFPFPPGIVQILDLYRSRPQ